ncbi:hypothetical protein EOT10_09565 [Streptomyces antnestii]|uniref:Uncharacterized protein n=1 Tax=Streptomyces antnestii TaxID=2494256 RepID=A0A437PYS2_9ACTN|nr:hypothetical protein EOT10_09565 [Streptomyces sp. San01]
MCERAVCRSCRKATFEGCGRHVEEVLAGVPTSQRCACESSAGRGRSRTAEPATPSVSAPAGPGSSGGSPSGPRVGWWTRLANWAKSPA